MKSYPIVGGVVQGSVIEEVPGFFELPQLYYEFKGQKSYELKFKATNLDSTQQSETILHLNVQ